ncbi:MAG TPA: YlxR family protein [Solirubrobacteraceae bacterium]|nr:YlxR family protein [Solirubrobacteraceae bacterium]
MGAHVPRRRCVGCGRTASKPELLRIALGRTGAGRTRPAVLDRDGTMPGRGAYLCRGASAGEPAADCLALAIRGGGIARALRCAVTLPDELVESVSR